MSALQTWRQSIHQPVVSGQNTKHTTINKQHTTKDNTTQHNTINYDSFECIKYEKTEVTFFCNFCPLLSSLSSNLTALVAIINDQLASNWAGSNGQHIREILQMAESQWMHLMKSRTAPIKRLPQKKKNTTELQLNDYKNLNWILP